MSVVPVSVSRLKARLSHYLAKVRGGTTVIVTERGRPVARIEPAAPTDDPGRHLAALVAAGLARPPTHKLDETFFRRPGVSNPKGILLKALLGERGGTKEGDEASPGVNR